MLGWRGMQIIDTGLDETSCFFVDEDGLEVEHGYYFEELGFVGEPSFDLSNVVKIFEGGSFPFDLTRRKVSGPSHIVGLFFCLVTRRLGPCLKLRAHA